MPVRYFTGSENQSLLGTLLRAGIGVESASPLQNPVWLVLVAAVLVVTCWFVVRLPDHERPFAISLVLLFGLISYPATLVHYSVMLLMPLLVLGRRLAGCSFSLVLQATVGVGALFLLVYLRAFFAFAALWILLCVVAARTTDAAVVARDRKSAAA
jgi:hypothetical protein